MRRKGSLLLAPKSAPKTHSTPLRATSAAPPPVVKRVPLACGCAGCIPLETEYASDPTMLAFLKKKLLIRGWATYRSPAERAFQSAHSTWYAGAADRAAQMGGFGPSTHDRAHETPSAASEDVEAPEQAVLAALGDGPRC